MSDLVRFLRARLDEDVEHAEGVRTADWESRAVWEDLPDGVAYHARHFDPPRMLAEVEAKRRLIAEVWDYEEGFPTEHTSAREAEAVLKHLALPYAWHPDYDEAWRPA